MIKRRSDENRKMGCKRVGNNNMFVDCISSNWDSSLVEEMVWAECLALNHKFMTKTRRNKWES
jgi:hypothetical protein